MAKHHMMALFFHPATGELWLHIHDSSFNLKKFQTNERVKCNETIECSLKRHEVSNSISNCVNVCVGL